jgi:hypothetical protein
MRNNPIYYLRNLILHIILMNILPYKLITNNRTGVDLQIEEQWENSWHNYVLVLSWRDCGIPRKPSVVMVCILAEI